jgi:hypothetical protein
LKSNFSHFNLLPACVISDATLSYAFVSVAQCCVRMKSARQWVRWQARQARRAQQRRAALRSSTVPKIVEFRMAVSSFWCQI